MLISWSVRRPPKAGYRTVPTVPPRQRGARERAPLRVMRSTSDGTSLLIAQLLEQSSLCQSGKTLAHRLFVAERCELRPLHIKSLSANQLPLAFLRSVPDDEASGTVQLVLLDLRGSASEVAVSLSASDLPSAADETTAFAVFQTSSSAELAVSHANNASLSRGIFSKRELMRGQVGFLSQLPMHMLALGLTKRPYARSCASRLRAAPCARAPARSGRAASRPGGAILWSS